MGRCDLDAMYLSGRMPLAAGEPIGHEMIAEVVEVGEAVGPGLAAGQRVIVPAQISCGECRMCTAGETGRCEAVPLGASYGMGRAGGYGGAVSELVRVPFADAMLVPVPEAADPVAKIGLADMATDAWRAVGPQLQGRPGGSVLVLGGGARVIGIYATGLASCLGAGRVSYVDGDRERRRTAGDYGAETAEALDALAPGTFDIVVDALGDGALLSAALRLSGAAAVVTSVVPPASVPDLPMMETYYKGLTWTIARPNCRHGHPSALTAWASCGFRPEAVGPKRFAFEDAIEAWLDPALYVAVHRE